MPRSPLQQSGDDGAAGSAAVRICRQHGSDDGRNPSPTYLICSGLGMLISLNGGSLSASSSGLFKRFDDDLVFFLSCIAVSISAPGDGASLTLRLRRGGAPGPTSVSGSFSFSSE